ncbi:hypothetical protein ANTRET_LOCUS4753 [Anthophora retusa]
MMEDYWERLSKSPGTQAALDTLMFRDTMISSFLSLFFLVKYSALYSYLPHTHAHHTRALAHKAWTTRTLQPATSN